MIPLIYVVANDSNIDSAIDNLLKKNNFQKTQLLIITPMKTEITINQIRDLEKQLILRRQDQLLIAFKNFDNSSQEVQNSLLKIIEEKSNHNLFVFFVNNPNKVIDTIHSRAKIIFYQKDSFKPVLDKSLTDLLTSLQNSQTPKFLFNNNF